MTYITSAQQNIPSEKFKKLSIYNHAVWEGVEGVTFRSSSVFLCSILGTRGFSRVWWESSVLAEGRSREKNAGHYKDLTEIGNRARKVSGTQGIFAPKSHRNACFASYRGTDYVQQKKQYNQSIKPPGELYCLVPLRSFVMTVPTERRNKLLW